jgi:peptidoglycan/LPS O-acetylase OafA/YrhL
MTSLLVRVPEALHPPEPADAGTRSSRRSELAGAGSARSPALDGLRGIAVIAVVCLHLGLPGFRGGGVGVFAFFTLSGFIITFLMCVELAQTGRVRLGAFWMRRAKRLLPALVVTVVLSVLLATTLAGEGPGTPLRQALPALGYFSNWWRIWTDYHHSAMPLGPFDHTWSLSIEEQFYLTWPPLFLLMTKLMRGRPLRVAGLTLALAAGSAATRVFGWDSANPDMSANVLHDRTDSEAELLLLGAVAGILAWYVTQHPEVRWRLPAWLLPSMGSAGLVVLVSAFALQPTPEHPNQMHLFWTAGLTAIAAGVAMVCLHVLLNPRSALARVLGVSPLPQLGRISYGVYLYHLPVLLYISPHVSQNVALGRVIAVACTLTLAISSWWLIERPILALGRRGAPSASRGAWRTCARRTGRR